MTIYNRPSASVPVWAESGDKVQPTNPEVQTGWPLSNTPPSRQRFNWLQNFFANGIRYLLQRGIGEWAAGEDYAQYAKVLYTDGLTYRALIVSPTAAPGVVAGEWEVWAYSDSTIQPRVDKVLSKSVAGGANVTLTAAEANNGVLIFTGTLTANINVVIPNAGRRYAVFNNTGGAFSLSVKTSSGTALQIPQSTTKAYSIFCDGANNVLLAGAAADAQISKVNLPVTSAGQTTFSYTYTPGAVYQVTRNGSDVSFTATNGTTIVLSVGTGSSSDIVNAYICTAFQVANAVAKTGDIMSGALSVPAGATGDQVPQRQEVDAAIAAIKVVSSAARQTVVGGPITSAGLPNFLPATSGSLSVSSQNVTASVPFVVSAAGGFGSTGEFNRAGISTSNLTWSSLAASQTNYLYVDVSAAGVLTPGSTTLVPAEIFGGSPSVTNGQATYSIREGLMYVGNGLTAPPAYRVFVGEAVCSGSAVTSTVAYAYQGQFFSQDLPLSGLSLGLNSYAVNIGSTRQAISARLRCTSADSGYSAGDIIDFVGSFNSSSVFVPQFGTSGRNTAFCTTSTNIAIPTKTGGNAVALTTANWSMFFEVTRTYR